ncbi:Y1111-like protein [Mya arenaria]|uniref:Y1111-like protein n=1 Tax=Mya arenaria TaxID=6604 RepID=A0ABY7FKS7_MYAAR|nr:Y1111-like protein [Mya arenaria]
MEDFVLCDKKDYGGEMMIECPSESFDALEQYVAKFKDSIVSTTAEFEYPECNQLLFKKSGYANEIVLGHLSAKAKRIVCYFDIELDVDGKPKCIIYATSISDLQKAKAVVENSIVRTDCPMETFKKMEETLRQYELKNLLQVFENKEIVTYVCTKDALMDINNEYQHEETIIVSQPFMSYIRDKGEHEFQKMQKENYVDIQLVPEQHALVIKGSHRHIAKSKNMLKSMFVKRDNRLSLTSKQLRALENKLQSIEEKFNCCCSIDCMKDGKEIFFPFKEIHAIAVAVDSGSILDVQAEVLVNTVGTDLKLDTGFLSSQILKEAGSSIQKELTDKNQELPCKSGTCLAFKQEETIRHQKNGQEQFGISIKGRGRKVWEKIPGSKREVCVRLIGSSEKDVDGAESFLMDQDSNDRDTQKSSGSAQLKSAEKAYAQELEVSARINAGVLNYLNEWKALSDWKDQVTKVIKVNIKHDQVFGTHDAIMKFWNYLENEFPELPSIPATDLQEQDDAEIIPFGEFMITVKRGSIVESNTDCIVCLNGPTLTNTGGVAGAMKKVGGEAYVTELGKNVKQFGKLMCGECRVTDSGELQAKKVMHIYFPPFKDNFDIHMQQMLELALFVSLETADAYGFKSMSFPVLGTGHGGLTVGHCVNAYAHTFSKANGKLKNTRNIFVYAFDEKVQTSFSQAFRKHHPSTDDYHLDKGRFNIAKRTITVVVPELCNTLSVNAIISKVDEQLAGKSSSAQKIESLGNEEFFLKKESLKKECPLQKNYVLSQGSTGGQLLNVAIMHLNEPRWNILKDIKIHETDIFNSITNVLDKVERLHKMMKSGIQHLFTVVVLR